MARRDDREYRAIFEGGATQPAGMHRRPNAAGLSPRAARSSPTARILLWLAGWTLFAFGGTYRWTTIPFLIGAVSLAIVERPRPARRPYRVIDLSLIACLAVVTLQLIPLPPAIRLAIEGREPDGWYGVGTLLLK